MNEHYKYRDCGPMIEDNRVLFWTNFGTLPVIYEENHNFQIGSDYYEISLIRADVDNELGGYESFPENGEWWFCHRKVTHIDGSARMGMGYQQAASTYWEIWHTALNGEKIHLPLLGDPWKAGQSLW